VNDPDNPVVSGSDGVVDFGEIPSGTYLLREVEAPDRCECPQGWWFITVDANATTQKITGIEGAGPLLPPAFISTGDYTNLRLPNYEKTVLPLTGSVPMDLTIVAALLIGIASLIFITSRKKKAAPVHTNNILRFALIDILVAALIFMTFSIVATGVYAADTSVGSITVHRYEAVSTDVSKLPTEGKPLSGIPFVVQKVIIDPTPATSNDVVYSYGGKAYVLDNNGAYSAHTIATNGAGNAVFSGLPLGIYLVSEQSHSAASVAAPLLVGIPTVVSGASGPALYDVDVYPKAPFTPPNEDPKPNNHETEDGTVITPDTPDGNIVTDTSTRAKNEINEPNEPESGHHEVKSSMIPFGNFGVTSAWSLLSLIMSLIAIIISTMLIICRLVRRRINDDENDDGHEKERRNAFIARTLTVFFGILTPIVFLILDDMRLPMVWINKWTPYVALAFIIHIILLIIYKHRNNREEDSNETVQDP
jgi:hypothetical protein